MSTAIVTALRAEDRARFADILVDSFPASERDEPDQVIANIEQGRRRSLFAYDDNVLVGFAVFLDLPAVEVVLLEYMAVTGDARGRGIGGLLFDAVVAELAHEEVPCAGLVLEVEAPYGASGDEEIQRKRRISFYERHGALVVTAAPAYRVPSTMGPEALPFLLMWRPMAASGALGGALLRTVVEAILVVGHDLDAGDPFVASVLAELRL